MKHVSTFLLYMQTDKNSADSTIENYNRDIYGFFNFDKTPKDSLEITADNIREYIQYLRSINRAQSSINRMLCALKSFYKYLVDIKKVLKESPADNVKCAKKKKSLPKAISRNEVTAILDTARKNSLKERLIIELLYGLGGRVSEVASLRVEDVDFNEGFIRILGKGDKERQNPIHSGAITLIRLYMTSHNIELGYLFPSRLDKNKPMTREGIYKTVKRLAEEAGVDPSLVSPHVFRHSFATHLLDMGCDMSVVQEYLGHEDIATTRIYAQVTKTNKKANFEKFHPLAN